MFEPEFGVVLRGLDEIRPELTELAEMQPRIEYLGDPADNQTWAIHPTSPQTASDPQVCPLIDG